MGTVTIYEPSGTIITRNQAERPTLEDLQAIVGGLIAPVDSFLITGEEAYANDEGLLMDMAYNPRGTEAVHWPEPLVGPIVVLTGFPPHD